MPTSAKSTPHKNALDIRLAESVVFLRAGDATGRRRGLLADAPPGMLRGLLVLNLAKPTRITSIEVELTAKTNTAWPEGVGARRIEISEEHEIYSQSYVFFRAGHAPGSTSRRHLSVGPGLALEHEDEDHSERSSIAQQEGSASGHGHRGRSPDSRQGPESLRRAHRRYMSVDQTHFQRSFVTHRENTMPSVASPPYTPPYTPNGTPMHLSPSASMSHRAHVASPDQSPARSFEDLHRALESEPINGYTRSPYHSASNILPPESRRVSFDDDGGEFQLGSSSGPPPHIHVPDAGDETIRGRTQMQAQMQKNKRFSFASALFEAMVDRVRSRSPYVEQDPARLSGYTTPPRGRTMDRALLEAETESPARKEVSALGRVGEALGIEVEDGREYGDGWKEFRKGVYTYPISFAIPAKSPPSLSVDYGSVAWRLKAVVHRPGAFKSKLTAAHDITVVATPGEDDTEESESIVVERQWDVQMQYLIVISGRSFAIGGHIPVSITFMPWTKMKVHRISVIIEERVDYWTGFKRVVRTDPNNRVALLALKHPKKDGPPLLPLQADSDDPDAFARSPLAEVVGPSADPLELGEAMAGFMGPGPWTIRKDLALPGVGGVLHPTNKNRGSNISVGHMLKVVFRVERGDDEAMDPASGKRKLFDIVVQTPVHILSHLCNPEHTSLPAYSRLPDPGCAVSGAVSSEPEPADPGLPPSTATATAPLLDSTPSAGSITQRRSMSGARPTHHHASLSLSAILPHHNIVNHHPASVVSGSDQSLSLSLSQSASSRSSLSGSGEPASPAAAVNVNGNGASGHEREQGQGQHGNTTPELFERLVAGQESEEGEAPPSYEAAVTVESASASAASSGAGSGTGSTPVLTVEEHH